MAGITQLLFQGELPLIGGGNWRELGGGGYAAPHAHQISADTEREREQDGGSVEGPNPAPGLSTRKRKGLRSAVVRCRIRLLLRRAIPSLLPAGLLFASNATEKSGFRLGDRPI